MAKPPQALNISFRRVLRTFELSVPPPAPVHPEARRPLPPEKAARLAARELKGRSIDGEVLQISLDGGDSWTDVPTPSAIPTVDDTAAVSGQVWADLDGTGIPRPKAAPVPAPKRDR